jgi:glycosyltransferase involved in cell wall biosynthesis
MRFPQKKDWVMVFERKIAKYLSKHFDLSILSYSREFHQKPYHIDDMKVNIIPAFNIDEIFILTDKKFGFGALLLDSINDILKIFSTTIVLHKLNKKKKIDLIIVGTFFGWSLYSAFYAKLQGIPVVTQLSSYELYLDKKTDTSLRMKFIKHILTSLMALKLVDVVIPNSEDIAEKTIPRRYKNKVRVIPQGVDIKRFNRKLLNETVKKNQKDQRKLVVLNVGGLRAVKGWNHIIETAKILKSYNIEFQIVGGDDEFEEFNDRVRTSGLKNIKYLGEIDHDEIIKYYHNADIFFLPSLSEGLPNAMLEAAAMELALIGSGQGDTKKIIVEGKNGYFIKKPNAKFFAEKILYLYKNPGVLAKMKIEAREHIKQHFTIEKNLIKLVNIFHELTGSAGNPKKKSM